MKIGKEIFVVLVIGLVIGAAVAWLAKPAVIPKTVLRITYGTPWREFIEPAVEDFMKANPDIDVKQEVIPIDLDKKVTLDLAAGVAADIIMVDSFLAPEYVEAEYLLPLNEYLAEWPDWGNFYDSMKEMVTIDGVSYSIVLDTDVRGIWVVKPNMTAAGIALPTEPKTWDDMLDAAEKLKAAGVKTPLLMQLGSTWGEGSTMQTFYMLSLGATSPEMGPQNLLRDWEAGKWIGKSPAILHSFEFIDTIIKEGYLPPEMLVGEVWAIHRKETREGRIGLNVGGSWEWAEFWPAEIRPPVEEREKLLEFVKMPGRLGGHVSISGGWTIGINKLTENPDLAWALLETLFEKERHGKWLAAAAKITPRADVLEVPEYAADEFLVRASGFLEFSTFRDTYPGYTKVSTFNQFAIDKLIAGEVTPKGAMDYFYGKLVEEFGADKVKVIP